MFPTALWHCFIWKLWNPQPPVCCLSTPSNVPKIQLRLAGQKRKHNEGRVEVFYSGEWGTVCDDDFSIHAAHVVCRELGYVEAVSWLPSSKYGKGEGKIWMDNVHCNGKEPTLAACTSNGWGVTDCKHTEDVGVVCSEKRIPGFKFDNSLLNQIEVEDIRIRPILATYRKRVPVTEGYVEVKDEGAWKQICDKHWTMKNSRVVCGMFGFPSERKYNTNVYKRKQHYWAYSMDCSGNEAHISSCKLGNHLNVDAEKNATCDSGMPAVVSCVPGRAFAPSSHSGFRKAFRQEVPQGNQPLVRLKGGANTGEGRVEVLKNGEWGTVCDDNWNLVSASVVCRELGFGSAKEAITGARLGQDVQKQYECANFGEQGITVGCWDVYRHDIDCQWIDITDVPPGDYLFQVVINPNYEVAESDYSNNVMKCRSRYDGQRIWMYNCHIGESYRAGGFARYTGFNTEINSQCLPPSNQSQREGKLQGWLRPFKECFS
uniref:Lysyl oxidase homolog n=1 Tax=Amazona collaria TaxID=241587 RepID=A0A8B9FZM5_9PSIT